MKLKEKKLSRFNHYTFKFGVTSQCVIDLTKFILTTIKFLHFKWVHYIYLIKATRTPECLQDIYICAYVDFSFFLFFTITNNAALWVTLHTCKNFPGVYTEE